MEKDAVRALMRSRLAALLPSRAEEASRTCCGELARRLHERPADLVLCYMALGTEVDVCPLMHGLLSAQVAVAVPRTERGAPRMDFYLLDRSPCARFEDQLPAGAWGIREPPDDAARRVSLEPLAYRSVCALVPGVAFTAGGKRLGHGRAYYDVYLERLARAARAAHAELRTVGVCFCEQMLDDLPVQAHDVPLDAVICG